MFCRLMSSFYLSSGLSHLLPLRNLLDITRFAGVVLAPLTCLALISPG
jgi:hypothetical protein